jgi:hypothetical protein
MTQTEAVSRLHQMAVTADAQNDGTDEAASAAYHGYRRAEEIVAAHGVGRVAADALRTEIRKADNASALAAWEGGSGFREANRKAALVEALKVLA